MSPFQEEMIRLLTQYITKFETKQCCFTDIKPYLRTLLSADKQGPGSGSLSTAAQLLQEWVRERVGQVRAELE